MKLKFGRAMVFSVVSFIALGLTTGYAWGWGILYPGAQVIDITRLNKSIQVTAEEVTTALQTLQIYRNTLTSLLSTSALGEVSTVLQSIKTTNNQVDSSLTGPMNSSQQAINPVPGQDNSISAWKNFADPTDDNLYGAALATQNAAMLADEEKANYDAMSVLRAQNGNLATIGNEVNSVAARTESGNLGQSQGANSERALITQMMMNNIYAEAATDIAVETARKGETTIENISARQNQSLQIASYDPYNRTAQDDALHPAQTAPGYPKF